MCWRGIFQKSTLTNHATTSSQTALSSNSRDRSTGSQIWIIPSSVRRFENSCIKQMKEHLNTGWQKFWRTQKWSENFCQARIFATNSLFLRVIANLTQYYMQYIPCNSALLARETLYFTAKKHFFAQSLPKSVLIATRLLKARLFRLKVFVRVQNFRRTRCSHVRTTSSTLVQLGRSRIRA